MTDHPITPPPELVQQWREESSTGELHFSPQYLATQAARWGADQELEACCQWMLANARFLSASWIERLRASRRPKPPSLKELALMALEDGDIGPGASLTPVGVCIIRRALEALPND